MTVKIDGTNTVANPAFTGADTDTGLQCGTNELKLVTGGSARATVDSSGNVGIGTTSPTLSNNSTGIHIHGSGSGGSRLHLTDSNTGTANSDGTEIVVSGSDLYIDQKENASTIFYTNGDERLRITSDGTLQLRNSPGIDFSQIQTNASGMTSETLDSYEEGTWTPILSGSSGFPAHTTQHGHYTKIGRLVHCRCNVTISSKNTLSGNLSIGGLPFTVSNVDASTSLDFGGVMNYFNNVSSTAYFISVSPEGGQTVAPIYFRGSGNAMDALSVGGINNNFSFRATFTYYA